MEVLYTYTKYEHKKMIAKHIIKRIIDEHYTILDIGCGSGVWESQAEGREFYGIDIKPFKPKHYEEFYKLDLDKHKLPFVFAGFDLVIAKDIIEHLTKPEKTLKEIHRVLCQNGTLIVKVPDYRSKNVWEDYTHKKPYTKNSIQNLLKDNGFKIKRVIRLGGHFLPMIFPQPFSWLIVAERGDVKDEN